MKVAIIGAGISGLTAGYQLHPRHEVTLFEANDYAGGHTNTVRVEHQDESFSIDTGFIVFNDRTYPNFCRLLDDLGVASQPTTMSFGVSCQRTGLEYRGADLPGLFGQRRNFVRPAFWGMLRDVVRFNRDAVAILEQEDPISVRDFFASHRYGTTFVQQYFIPMAEAIWSCPHQTIQSFPMRFLIAFYRNHGLLALKDRPQWRVIQGGSQQYVGPLTDGFRDRIHLRSPVERVERTNAEVRLTVHGETLAFDQVIFACHSDQALRILGASATELEREILGHFPYQLNDAVLHTDQSMMPRRRRCWASWNYLRPKEMGQRAPVSYYMNRLQSLQAKTDFFVTLNAREQIDPATILWEGAYSHPVYLLNREAAAARHPELLGPNRTYFCGAYWRNGFHEDGVASALAACDKLEQDAQAPHMVASL